MLFFRQLKFWAPRPQSGAKAPDTLGALLDEFKAAPVPASQTDWQDLQRRMASPQRTQRTQARAKRREARIAFAVCIPLLLLATGHALRPSARVPTPLTGTKTSFLSKADAPFSSADEGSCKTEAPLSKFRDGISRIKGPFFIKTASERPISRHRPLHCVKIRRLRTVARRSALQLAAHPAGPGTQRRVALTRTSDAAPPEANRLALSVDGENMMFLLQPMDYVLPTVQTAPTAETPQTYVVAAIPAAPTPGTTENEPKELQPW